MRCSGQFIIYYAIDENGRERYRVGGHVEENQTNKRYKDLDERRPLMKIETMAINIYFGTLCV